MSKGLLSNREEMVMSTMARTAVRELDRRINDGFDVRLLWEPQTNLVAVSVEDQRHGDSFAFEVDPADALEAFHHPFAYPGNPYDTRSQPVEHLPTSPLRVEERR
jgi:hypothetical protein